MGSVIWFVPAGTVVGIVRRVVRPATGFFLGGIRAMRMRPMVTALGMLPAIQAGPLVRGAEEATPAGDAVAVVEG